MISQIAHSSFEVKERIRRPEAQKHPLQTRDTEKPVSSEPHTRLEAIQKKIKNGYYNSDAVLDDLSQSMAGAFDKLL